jgi:hypothetical protein
MRYIRVTATVFNYLAVSWFSRKVDEQLMSRAL